MGLDVEVTGIELSKRKVEQKGLQHYINNELFKDRTNYVQFALSFREPDGDFIKHLLAYSECYVDELNIMNPEAYYYVINEEGFSKLIESGFNEQRFKDTTDVKYYHDLMARVYGAEERLNKKFRNLYIVIEIYY